MVDDPRNALVRVLDVERAGHVIAPCVMEDSVKIDRATGYLDRFKSRLCYDQARVTRIKRKLGREEFFLLYFTDTDDITFKLFLGDAVMGTHAECNPDTLPDDVTYADLSNAYWHADRYYAEYCWMHTYDEIYDEEGFRLCYRCGALGFAASLHSPSFLFGARMRSAF